MVPEQDFAEYRERLLKGVRAGIRRSACGATDLIQVFMNQRCIGVLDGKGVEAALQVQTDVHIDSIPKTTCCSAAFLLPNTDLEPAASSSCEIQSSSECRTTRRAVRFARSSFLNINPTCSRRVQSTAKTTQIYLTPPE